MASGLGTKVEYLWCQPRSIPTLSDWEQVHYRQSDWLILSSWEEDGWKVIVCVTVCVCV